MPAAPSNKFAVFSERWVVEVNDDGALAPTEKVNSVAQWYDSMEDAFEAFERVDVRGAWMKERFENLANVARVCKIVDGRLQETLAEKSFSFDDYTWELLMRKLHPDEE